MATDSNERVSLYFDIKLNTLKFIIEHRDDFTSSAHPTSYFADLVFFAEFFGFDHDPRFSKASQAFCKAYNLNPEDYDIDTADWEVL